MRQHENVAIARLASKIEFAVQVVAEASARGCSHFRKIVQLAHQQVHEAIDRRPIVAGGLALHQFANQRDDGRLFRSCISEKWMHRCYNSQFACPSWTFRPFATFCRIVTPCCWWTQSLSSKRNESSASRT